MLRAPQTCVRARTLTFQRRINCHSHSTILSLASLIYCRISICRDSERAGLLNGRRRFESRWHHNQHACQTTCIPPLFLSRTLPPVRIRTPCCTRMRPSELPRHAFTRSIRTRDLAILISNRMCTHLAVNSRVQVLIL